MNVYYVACSLKGEMKCSIPKSFMSALYDAFVIFFFGTLNTIILKTLLTCSLFNYSIYNLV